MATWKRLKLEEWEALCNRLARLEGEVLILGAINITLVGVILAKWL